MEILKTIVQIVNMLSALGLIVLVLLQHGKGADMGLPLVVVLLAVCSARPVLRIFSVAVLHCWLWSFLLLYGSGCVDAFPFGRSGCDECSCEYCSCCSGARLCACSETCRYSRVTKVVLCRHGEIGRHAILGVVGNPCEFESHCRHHLFKQFRLFVVVCKAWVKVFSRK